MWTSTIKGKDFVNGQFRVSVEYTDGTNTFSEVHNLSNQENLDRTIRSRIAQLEATATFSTTVSTGPYTPSEEVKATPTAYDLAIQEVSRVKNLVELGILKETDKEFIDAITALKAEYAKK